MLSALEPSGDPWENDLHVCLLCGLRTLNGLSCQDCFAVRFTVLGIKYHRSVKAGTQAVHLMHLATRGKLPCPPHTSKPADIPRPSLPEGPERDIEPKVAWSGIASKKCPTSQP